jgi:hypothetical protein
MNDARAAGAHDFVDRLVVKAFGGAEVAAARVPSAFEPVRPGAGLAAGASGVSGASRAGRIGEDALFDDDAMDGDPYESPDRRWRSQSTRTLAADGARSLDARAGEEGDRTNAARPRRPRRRAQGRGDATDGRDAGSSSARVIDDPDAAGALVPAQALSLSNRESKGSQPSDHLGGDAADASIARSAFGADGSHSSGLDDQATTGPLTSDGLGASDAPHVVQPSAHLRASLDMSPFRRERENGGEDGATADDRGRGWGAASENSARDGVLMPFAHGVWPHAPNDRAGSGWGDIASRRSSAEVSAQTHDVTVNVTIGRVDVRAVQAAAPAARPARARGAQPLALDEYLARHGGAR